MAADETSKRGRGGHGRPPKPESPMKSVPYLLQLTARLQTVNFMSTLAHTKVHPAEAYVIHALWEASPLSQSQLSSRLDVGNAAIGKTLTRLERGGFIVRSRMPSDGRRVMVRLTDKGLAVHDTFQIAAETLLDDISTVLSPDENKRLKHYLNLLANHFRDQWAARSGTATSTSDDVITN